MVLLFCVVAFGLQIASRSLSQPFRAESIAHEKNRKLNTSPAKIEDKEILHKLLVTPPVKKIDLKWPLGLEVTARNLKGVTIKDALDAIYKQFKKKVCLLFGLSCFILP